MRFVSVEKVIDDMVIAKDLFRADGTIVLGKGVKLKGRYIDRIKELGIKHIYIEDNTIPEVIVKDIVKEETRQDGIVLIKNVMDNLTLSDHISVEEVKETVNEIVNQLMKNDEIVINLAEIRATDDYTFGHSVNVGVLSIVTGISMGYLKDDLMELGVGAILHDVGKMRVPQEILQKPGKLTNEEYDEIKKHTIYGYDILKSNDGISETSKRIALLHHERFDGNGYPNEISGEKIHQFARIVSVADVYDALTTDRVYKDKIKTYQAIEYMISAGGHQFDYNIVRKFLSNIAIFPLGKGVILNTGQKGYVVKVRKDFPTRPVIKIIYNPNNKKIKEPFDLDLIHNNSVFIIETTDEM